MANLTALIYNWWHLYARLYDADHHREAITSRPALLHGVARLTRSGGQRTVKVSAHFIAFSRIPEALSQPLSSSLFRFQTNTNFFGRILTP